MGDKKEKPQKIVLVGGKGTPHTCPVCGGNGLVPNGFYNQTSGDWLATAITPEQCRSCGGTGIVYSQ